MKRKRVVVLQGMLAGYRRPVFNRLGRLYDLTVAHAGPVVEHPGDTFRQVRLPSRKLGPFHFVDRAALRPVLGEADAAVAMFDLAWPQFLLPALQRRARPRIILWGHRYGVRPLANAVRDALMRRCPALLMYGWEHHERMRRAGIDPARIYVAPNTMDVPNHHDGTAEPKCRFLFVGRLQPRKRLDQAIRAFAAVQGVLPPGLTFDIVGDGPERGALEAVSRAAGVGRRVVFHGEIGDDRRLAELFGASLAYISPGAVGLSVLHAFAYGVPVVTIDDGANYHGPEFHNLVDGENGLVLRDAAALPDALQMLAGDPAMARRLGARAYAHYRDNRTIERMVQGFVAAIEGTPPPSADKAA